MTISPSWVFQLILDCLFDERSENVPKTADKKRKGEKKASNQGIYPNQTFPSFPVWLLIWQKTSVFQSLRALHSDLSGAPASGGGAGEAGNDGAIEYKQKNFH